MNGTDRTLSVIKAPFRDGAGRIVGLIGTVRDETVIRRLEQETGRFFDLAPDMLCTAGAERPPRARQRGMDRGAGLDRRRAALAAADRLRAPRRPRPGGARARADVLRCHRRLRDAPGHTRRRLARGRVDRPRRARGRAHLRRRARRHRAQQDGGRAGRQRGPLPHARAQPAELGRRHVRPRPALHVRGRRRRSVGEEPRRAHARRGVAAARGDAHAALPRRARRPRRRRSR